MKKLICSAKQLLETQCPLPFSVYTSVESQRIANVPIIKPILVCVLDGCKKLGKSAEINCQAGNFIFLSASQRLEIQNIPLKTEYLALIIEFDYDDFKCLKPQQANTQKYFCGEIDSSLKTTLQQFVDWSAFAPVEMWSVRRQEILQLLYHSGFEQVSTFVETPVLKQKLYDLIRANVADDLSVQLLASELAMSESTLRRKLQSEGTSFQEIKNNVKLGYGLHLVQTSFYPIGHIAEACGYQSQSRFTDKFKQLFGLTPTELRKTRLSE